MEQLSLSTVPTNRQHEVSGNRIILDTMCRHCQQHDTPNRICTEASPERLLYLQTIETKLTGLPIVELCI